MTKHVVRLYSLVAGVVVFFVAWAAVAAHPWQTTAAADPRLAALTARQQALQKESTRVKQILDRRFAAYRAALSSRNAAIARLNAGATARAAIPVGSTIQGAAAPASAAPAVRVVTLPPLVITRTS